MYNSFNTIYKNVVSKGSKCVKNSFNNQLYPIEKAGTNANFNVYMNYSLNYGLDVKKL